MLVRIVVLLIALGFLPGCSLIGLGIGAAIPKTVPEDLATGEAMHPKQGDRVHLQMDNGELMDGVLGTSDTTNIEITTGEGSRSVLIERIETMRVEQRKANHALEGLGIGFVVDLMLGLAVYGLSQVHNFSLMGNGL